MKCLLLLACVLLVSSVASVSDSLGSGSDLFIDTYTTALMPVTESTTVITISTALPSISTTTSHALQILPTSSTSSQALGNTICLSTIVITMATTTATTSSSSGVFEAATVVLSVYAVCTTLTILVLVLVLVYLCFRMRMLTTTRKAGTQYIESDKADLRAHRKATDGLEMKQNEAYNVFSYSNPQHDDDYEYVR